ncbi:hypothetical protein BDP27DRAFT_1444943 [Rhodocollybia butyracea]|uniref:F-box domain-containing protein n=1 Tax=Rhodocollybia butyracea TaxID=206335 RepID=A0A9P5Q2V6_9AGAR|nr:hypothetical protein BDP27DRAFT_1444943 [Rhodocollybia butyracea]
MLADRSNGSRQNTWTGSSCHYPIHRLPCELLVEIFSFCSSTGLCISGGEYPISNSLHLAQTCSRWRTICLTSPTLWNEITANLVDVNANDARLIELYLRYSRDMPLMLTISDIEFYDEGKPVHAEELEEVSWNILASLTAACRRWARVSIDMNWQFLEGHRGAFSFANVGFPVTFPLLEYLSIHWDPIGSIVKFNKSNALLDQLALAGNVRQLELLSYNSAIPISLKKLTRITVRALTHTAFHKLLSECVCVEYIAVDHYVLSEQTCDIFSTSSSLQNLRLSFEPLDTPEYPKIGQFFHSIALPCLKELHFQATCTEFIMDNLIDMLHRSGCARGLVKLSLNAIVKDTDLLNLFKLTPNLQTLMLHPHVPITDHLFSGLTLPTAEASTKEALLPHLDHLFVACRAFSGPLASLSLNMLGSRCIMASVPKSLQSFTLHLPLDCRHFVDGLFLHKLHSLSVAGLSSNLAPLPSPHWTGSQKTGGHRRAL